MTIREPRRLEKEEPIQVHIPIWLVVVASLIFAIIFFIIGSIFRHYPSLLGVI